MSIDCWFVGMLGFLSVAVRGDQARKSSTEYPEGLDLRGGRVQKDEETWSFLT